MFIKHAATVNELQEMFGVRPIRTAGMQSGWIIKYDRLYLKLYNVDDCMYRVKVYEYDNDTPIKDEKIHESRLREFSEQFRHHSYNQKNRRERIIYYPLI